MAIFNSQQREKINCASKIGIDGVFGVKLLPYIDLSTNRRPIWTNKSQQRKSNSPKAFALPKNSMQTDAHMQVLADHFQMLSTRSSVTFHGQGFGAAALAELSMREHFLPLPSIRRTAELGLCHKAPYLLPIADIGSS